MFKRCKKQKIITFLHYFFGNIKQNSYLADINHTSIFEVLLFTLFKRL